MLELFQTLEYSSLLVEMRSSTWLFPLIASAHLLGLVVLSGAVLVVDLRLLGLGLSRQPVARLARDAERWLLAGLLVMLPTGLLLFLCFATKYYYLAAFWTKITCLGLVLAFTFTVRRRVVTRDHASRSTMRDGTTAVVSLSLWATVALSGRLIGFP